MIFSSDVGWLELEKGQPALARLLAYVVLPIALLPPLMLYLTGASHGDAFVTGFGGKPWGLIATVFFVAEMIGLLLMGWLISRVAAAHRLRVSSHDAYVIACIAPIPLWLSSLGLMVPNLGFNAAVSVAALAATCGLVYHGVSALAHTREEISALGITQTVMGAGLVIWALLLGLIVAL